MLEGRPRAYPSAMTAQSGPGPQSMKEDQKDVRNGWVSEEEEMGEGAEVLLAGEDCRNPFASDNVFIGDPVEEGEYSENLKACVLGVIADGTHGGFPGSQPVSLDSENKILLKQMDYQITWKADGTRYMLYLNENGYLFFVDRRFNFFFLDEGLGFVAPGSEKADEIVPLCNTLLDGELVVDNVNGNPVPSYLVYDAMKVNGVEVCEKDLTYRLRKVKELVHYPRKARMFHHPEEYSGFEIKFGIKRFESMRHTAKFMRDFVPTLLHENDGIIFTPTNDPYIPGRAPHLLKWKPAHLNSVDLKLEIKGLLPHYNNPTGFRWPRTPAEQLVSPPQGFPEFMKCHLYCGASKGELKNAGTVLLSRERSFRFRGKIVECVWDKTIPKSLPGKSTGSWLPIRVRVDKEHPNGLKTLERVVLSINDDYQLPYILGLIEKVYRQKDARRLAGRAPNTKRVPRC